MHMDHPRFCCSGPDLSRIENDLSQVSGLRVDMCELTSVDAGLGRMGEEGGAVGNLTPLAKSGR